MSAVPVIYETPSRRRHFRVTAPAEVVLDGVSHPTKDWSAGGFAIERPGQPVKPGDRLAIRFSLDFQGFAISFAAVAEVVHTAGGLLGAKFVDLGERESGLLRHFASALLSGQMVSVTGVLKHIDRPTGTPPGAAAVAGPGLEGRRSIRTWVIAGLYLLAGIAAAGVAALAALQHMTSIHVQSAVTSVALEPVLSVDTGIVAGLYVEAGAQVAAGQPLCRVASEAAEHNVQTARRQLEAARIAVREAQSRREQEENKLRAYQSISGDQLEATRSRMRALATGRDEARAEFERARALMEQGLISRQLYENQEAALARHEALVEQALAEQKIAATSAQAAGSGLFFSGNFLVGERALALAEESAARERVTIAESALEQALAADARRIYRAPFQATVVRAFKSAGMTVDRGEPLLVLRKTGEESHIDAYLTQDEAGRLEAGAFGMASLGSGRERYRVQVVAVDHTAGFLTDAHRAKWGEPQFGWSGAPERSAYARIVFVGLSAAERASIAPGLPADLVLRRSRPILFSLLPTVHAASRKDGASTRHAPRLWPSDSPLFSGAPVTQPGFAAVRGRVLDAAEQALKKSPAPVTTIHSAGVTDLSSPEFERSRRALQDADSYALLALAYKLTGHHRYRDRAGEILAAWANTNQPTGNPIDETRLDTFLWGLDLFGPDAETPAVRAWLERWAAAKRNWRFGPNTEANNHKTHHLKILLMLDQVLRRDADYGRDLAEVEQHRRRNLSSPDGMSIDYQQRDAMHYHVFNLEAWLEIALATNCCREAASRAFRFFETTLAQRPEHIEFAGSTAPIDRRRAAAGFEYAKPHAYDPRKAARAIFAYAALQDRPLAAGLWAAAEAGSQRSNLFHEARSYLWRAHP